MSENKTKVSLEQLFEQAQRAQANGDTCLITPTMSSFKGGASKLSRANVTEVWVTQAALNANDYSLLNVCHLGDVSTRVTVYTTAQSIWDANGTDLVIFEGVSIAVLDLAENNDNWDEYGALENNEKRQVLSDLGAQFHGWKSTRGHKGHDNIKAKWEALRKK